MEPTTAMNIAQAGGAAGTAAVTTALVAAGSPLAAPAFILFAFVTVIGALTIAVVRLAPVLERQQDRFGIGKSVGTSAPPMEEALGPTAITPPAGLPPPTKRHPSRELRWMVARLGRLTR